MRHKRQVPGGVRKTLLGFYRHGLDKSLSGFVLALLRETKGVALTPGAVSRACSADISEIPGVLGWGWEGCVALGGAPCSGRAPLGFPRREVCTLGRRRVPQHGPHRLVTSSIEPGSLS